LQIIKWDWYLGIAVGDTLNLIPLGPMAISNLPGDKSTIPAPTPPPMAHRHAPISTSVVRAASHMAITHKQ
jgi:hypothetical protein